MLVSQNEFARMQNVSGAAVSKWKKRGLLVLQGSEVDVEASLKHIDKYRDGGDVRATRGKTREKKSSTKSINQRSVNASVVNTSAAELGDEDSLILPGESVEDAAQRLAPAYDQFDPDMSIEEARRMKEVYRALLNRLEFEKASGSVIDLQLARTTLFECARGARDAWLNWPAKYSPLIAASLGLDSDKVLPLLEEFVHKQVAALGLPDPEAFVEAG